MERFRKRLVTGAVLMAIGFLTVLTVLSELVTGRHLAAWSWALFMLVGVGAALIVSAFVSTAAERRRATERVAGPARPAPRRR